LVVAARKGWLPRDDPILPGREVEIGEAHGVMALCMKDCMELFEHGGPCVYVSPSFYYETTMNDYD
jgi:hypothetical protein